MRLSLIPIEHIPNPDAMPGALFASLSNPIIIHAIAAHARERQRVFEKYEKVYEVKEMNHALGGVVAMAGALGRWLREPEDLLEELTDGADARF